MKKLHIPEYKYPEPHYLEIDLRLELGNATFKELERWLDKNKRERLADGVRSTDVDAFLDSW